MFPICDKSCSFKLGPVDLHLSIYLLAFVTMSTSFANRRKPRKIGGDDEEDRDGSTAPGLSAMSTLHMEDAN